MNKLSLKKIIIIFYILIFVFLIFKNTTNNQESISQPIEETKEKQTIYKDVISIELLSDTKEIYSPGNNKGYRYGPSIIINEDQTYDCYFSSPGNNYNEWDYIRYRHTDSDFNYQKEEIVLRPTRGSLDACSVCDPGVFQYGEYYYIGYTATNDSKADGFNNSLFIARSKNPNGPFEKWNGEGWGKDVYPIIMNYSPEAWGYGEPSFVVVNDKLYMYYSAYLPSGYKTMVITASLNDENWPSHLSATHVSFYKYDSQDSCDVVYIEEDKKFLALTIANRMKDNSSIYVFESEDGLNFYYVDNINEGIEEFAHNIGISKRSNGHVSREDNLYIAYSYGSEWGRWPTVLKNIKLKDKQIEVDE